MADGCQGAAIPLVAMTAAVGFYLRLGLPEPWKPTSAPTPLIVYGASGAVVKHAIHCPDVTLTSTGSLCN